MNTAEIERTIDLAMLDSDGMDVTRLAAELERFLQYVATMETAAVDAVSVTTHGTGLHSTLRPDQESRFADADRVLACSPDLEDRGIAIPNVL